MRRNLRKKRKHVAVLNVVTNNLIVLSIKVMNTCGHKNLALKMFLKTGALLDRCTAVADSKPDKVTNTSATSHIFRDM